jgi:hypothetical protein
MGSFPAAEEIYRAIVKETPSNQLAAKRLITLSRQQAGSKTGRQREEADLKVLEQMNEYLLTFGSDVDAVRLVTGEYCANIVGYFDRFKLTVPLLAYVCFTLLIQQSGLLRHVPACCCC